MLSRLLLAIVVVSVGVLGAVRAWADPRTDFLADQLRNDDDFRVRTQAALALGASGDSAAVAPLCGGLSDKEKSVRVAAAAALGKLGKKQGVKCLKKALGKEGNGSVKAQIEKSLGRLEGNAPPPPKSSDKYYVAIEVTNRSKRSNGEVEALVRGAIQKELLAANGFAVAPSGESVSASGGVIQKNNLKGFYILASVEAPDYSGGNLTQVVKVSFFTYPDKALKGGTSPKLTQQGTSSEDDEGERILMQMCAETAAQNFVKVAAAL